MKRLRFKLGDRVVGKDGAGYIAGNVGTVVEMIAGHHDYGIKFDLPIEGGHDLGMGIHKYIHCRWVEDDELEPYNDAVPAPYFADARVGDSVYDMAKGEGEILAISDSIVSNPLFVQFTRGGIGHYTMEGICERANNQTLFYSKPIFDLPPPPKRTVKKVIEGWVNVYAPHSDDPENIYTMSETEKAADNKARGGKRLGKAVFIRHEYEE